MEATNKPDGLNREELLRERENLEKQISDLLLQRSFLKRKIVALDVLLEDAENADGGANEKGQR